MANKFIVPSVPVVGVGVSARATADLVRGPRYHVLWLKLLTHFPSGADVTLAKCLGDIILKINGRPQRTHSATQLNRYNSLMGKEYAAKFALASAPATMVGYFNGMGTAIATPASSETVTTVTVGTPDTNTHEHRFGEEVAYGQVNSLHYAYLPIFFAEPWRKQYAATDRMALPTSWPGGAGPIGTLQLEITLGANSDTIPALEIIQEVDYQQGFVDANGAPILELSKWNRLNHTYSGASEAFLTTLPRYETYQQITLEAGQGSEGATHWDTITNCKMKIEGNQMRDTSKALNDLSLIARGLNAAALAETPNIYDLVFDYDDVPSNALPMVYGGKQIQDFQVIPTLAGGHGSTLGISYQTFGPLS